MLRYNEIEPYAAAWIRNLIAVGELPDGVVDERSIVDLRGDDLAGCDEAHFFAGIGVWARAVAEAEEAAGHRLARPLFTGSCPCQPLSVAGQGKGDLDQRHLWPAFHRLIAERRPATILGEQVASKDGREWMAAVRVDLEASGYAVGCAVLPAAGFGASHLRYRLFFVADAQGGNQRGYSGKPRSETGARGDEAWPPDGNSVGGPSGLDIVAKLRRWTGEVVADDGQAPVEWPGCVLADAEGIGRREERADAGRLAERDRAQGLRAGSGASGSDSRSRPLHRGYWDDCDWIFCRDNKWRPVEPGSQPLVDGAAFRLGSGGPFEGQSRSGMLRGYGNAVVLPVARAFVECAMEALHAH